MKLLNLSYIIMITGLLALTFLEIYLPLNISEISSLSFKQLDQTVKVSGYITKTFESNNFKSLTIKDSTGIISINLFNSITTFKKGSTLIAQGKLTKYKNSLQINADTIIIVSD